jgi:glycosyltransferase involved in cell wall biosynthesis
MENIGPPRKSVLAVAFHFPPQAGSSGQLRILKFCRYLPEFGWSTAVLTLSQHAYEAIELASESNIPSETKVYRAFALDTKRHLGFRGIYPNVLALPDRWASWLVSAIPIGLRALRRERANVIMTTFPIATAVLVGLVLHKLTQKPWVLDFRDSMTEDTYPADPRLHRLWRWLERQAVGCASRILFTAPSTRAIYLERYPHLKPEHCLLISNGYDEEDFKALDSRSSVPGQPMILLHTGLLYPEERDPKPFFAALASLKRSNALSAESVQFIFRAPGNESLYRRMLQQYGISDLVQLKPHVQYAQSLRECAEADGLLLFQAANCDHQIPAKAYEYLRLQKPIFGPRIPVTPPPCWLR